jgi:hypothetical protein
MPQFITTSDIVITLEKYFITLFIPKITTIKTNKMKFINIKKNIFNYFIPYTLKISTIEKYLVTNKLNQLKNYLIYLIFLYLTLI